MGRGIAAALPPHTLLRLDPDIPHAQVRVAPELPDSSKRLVVSRIPIGTARADIAVNGDTVEVTGLGDEIELMTTPAPP